VLSPEVPLASILSTTLLLYHTSAREHALSSHSPICRTCGLILCSINQAYYACPHCASLLLTSLVRISLEERLERSLFDAIKKEAEERQRAIEEAHKAAGAFPALPGTSTTNWGQSRSSNQPHKVLSLNAKSKKMTLLSYTPNPTSSSRFHIPQEVEKEFRVPPPPAEVKYARSKPNPNQPWRHIEGGNVYYIPVSQIDGEDGSKGLGKTKRGY